jgi:antitoxin (DNA-binding transcriptional repressor) of toxin-antitoxin stability system
MWLPVATIDGVKKTPRVGIKRLKNNLSAYVRRVRNGERILVMDREDVVAELRPAEPEDPELANPLLRDLVARGWVRLPLKPRSPLPEPALRPMPQGTAQRLIDEERGE